MEGLGPRTEPCEHPVRRNGDDESFKPAKNKYGMVKSDEYGRRDKAVKFFQRFTV